MKHIGLWAVGLILAIVISVIYPVQFVRACEKTPDFFKKSINIGGYKLYIHSEGKGKPVVVFDSGYGDSSESWSNVQTALSKTFRSVSYDRAGLGKSGKSPYPRTSVIKAWELHELLHKAGINGPFILVGHSLGAYNVRMFASMYPNEVKGIVLIEPTHEDHNEKMILTQHPEVQEFMKSQFNAEGTYEEFLESSKQVKATRKCLKNIPLTVITATNHGVGQEYEDIWMKMQKDTVSLSKYGKHIIAEGCNHYVQNEKPEIVINAIKDMISSLNKKHCW